MASKQKRVARRVQRKHGIPYMQALHAVRDTLALPDLQSRMSKEDDRGLQHDDALFAVVCDVWVFE